MDKVEIFLVKERIASNANVSCPADIYNLSFIQELRHADREKFVVVHLNARNMIISYEVVSIGTLNASMAHPREVFKAAILNNAASIMLIHNHPSGDLEPTGDDVLLTARLKKAGEILGIEVLDHIIASSKGYKSLKEGGSL